MTMIEFVAAGSPRVLSRAIEDFAAAQRIVAAIVVPWESDSVTLTMSVTAVSGDGWAIEHENLGSIRLTDLGGERTRVMVAADHVEQASPKRSALFDRFAQEIQTRFETP
jgi:hypothetical protein